MPAHPLYEQLRALEQQIRALRQVSLPPVAEDIAQPWERPIFVTPALDGNVGPLGQYSDWSPALNEWYEPGKVSELPGDLAAQLSWERGCIDREVLLELRKAAAQESQWLAYLQIEAMLRRQPEVTDEELDLSVPPAEASRQAEQLREKIIEEALADERGASQARLEKLGKALEQDRAQALAEIRQELEAKAQNRRSYRAEDRRKLAQQLQERLEQFAATVEPIDEPMSGPAPTADRLGKLSNRRGDAAEEYQEAAAAQIKRLAQRKMALISLIEQAVRRAAQRVAWQENWDLHLVPEDEPIGKDFTPVAADKLVAFWAAYNNTMQEANSR